VKLEKEVGEMKMNLQKDGTELEKELKGYIENECQKKKLEENKKLLDAGIIKVSEQLKSENKNDTSRKDVVSKKVEDRFNGNYCGSYKKCGRNER
jgi:hypothetical protein